MNDFEQQYAGNFRADDIESPHNSLVKEWERQGISHDFTAPLATESHSVDRLVAMGMVGIMLTIPESEQ